MPFAIFVVQSIGLQNGLLAPQAFQHSLIVAIVARSLLTHYQNHRYPSALFLWIKLLKHDTFVIPFANTIPASCSHPSVLPRMRRSSMATALSLIEKEVMLMAHRRRSPNGQQVHLFVYQWHWPLHSNLVPLPSTGQRGGAHVVCVTHSSFND